MRSVAGCVCRRASTVLLVRPLRAGRKPSPASALRPIASAAGPQQPSMEYRQPIVIPAKQQHTGTVIMLHGLGDQGDGWAPLGAQWADRLPNVKFVFPHAPLRKITLNMGMRMPGWYDIASLDDIDQREDREGLMESKRYVESLVAAEAAAGVPSERVIVAGFSQGGAVAMLALRSEHKLAAVIGLSTYMPLAKAPPVVSEANKATPILQCHGDADMTVQYHFGQETHKLLQAAGANVTFKVYPKMGHGACDEELQDVAQFIRTTLA